MKQIGRGVERLVGAEVRPGEWPLVLLLFANLFLLLAGYYILKVVREPLILTGGGAVSRSYARGAQAVVVSLIVAVYGLLANHLDPARLVKWIMGFFVISLASFYALGREGVPIGFAFFVWLGIFSTLSIAQFWSLAIESFTESEAKRLFPLVAAGGTIGAIVGCQVAARAIGRGGPSSLMLVAAAPLAGCFVLTCVTHSRGPRRTRGSGAGLVARDSRGGLTLVLQDRYLLLIGLSVVILNLINTTGDFILAQAVNLRAQLVSAGVTDSMLARQRFVGAFYGDCETYISGLTALTQIVLVSRVFKKIGIARSLYLLPLFAVTGYGASALLPGLSLIATVKVVEDSAAYSLQNTIQQTLFLPTSLDATYKAKTTIDTLSVRLGDLASALLVFAGGRAGLTMLNYALANVVAGLGWLLLAWRLARRRNREPAPELHSLQLRAASIAAEGGSQ